MWTNFAQWVKPPKTGTKSGIYPKTRFLQKNRGLRAIKPLICWKSAFFGDTDVQFVTRVIRHPPKPLFRSALWKRLFACFSVRKKPFLKRGFRGCKENEQGAPKRCLVGKKKKKPKRNILTQESSKNPICVVRKWSPKMLYSICPLRGGQKMPLQGAKSGTENDSVYIYIYVCICMYIYMHACCEVIL